MHVKKTSSSRARRVVTTAAVAATASGIIGPGVPGLKVLSLSVLAQQATDGPQQPPRAPRSPYSGPAPAPSRIERISKDVVRIGAIVVDTAKKELAVGGAVNDVPVLEFLANTKGGFKGYESALELDTTAVDFNVACLLIGLDSTGAVVSRYQFDPQPPQGPPVEMFVEWDEAGVRRRFRAEQLIYNRVTKQTLTEGPWVYTGSVFLPGNAYMAENDGTLIGFMHTTAPIIENPRPMNGNYGDSIINPQLNLKPGTSIQLIVRALPRNTAPGNR